MILKFNLVSFPVVDTSVSLIEHRVENGDFKERLITL